MLTTWRGCRARRQLIASAALSTPGSLPGGRLLWHSRRSGRGARAATVQTRPTRRPAHGLMPPVGPLDPPWERSATRPGWACQGPTAAFKGTATTAQGLAFSSDWHSVASGAPGTVIPDASMLPLSDPVSWFQATCWAAPAVIDSASPWAAAMPASNGTLCSAEKIFTSWSIEWLSRCPWW